MIMSHSEWRNNVTLSGEPDSQTASQQQQQQQQGQQQPDSNHQGTWFDSGALPDDDFLDRSFSTNSEAHPSMFKQGEPGEGFSLASNPDGDSKMMFSGMSSSTLPQQVSSESLKHGALSHQNSSLTSNASAANAASSSGSLNQTSPTASVQFAPSSLTARLLGGNVAASGSANRFQPPASPNNAPMELSPNPAASSTPYKVFQQLLQQQQQQPQPAQSGSSANFSWDQQLSPQAPGPLPLFLQQTALPRSKNVVPSRTLSASVDHDHDAGAYDPLDGRHSLIQPHENDILMGRGGKNNQHAGNENLRRLAREYCTVYSAAAKKDKPSIAAQLVEHVQGLDPPGRYVFFMIFLLAC
jgi:hypothetical protein